METGKRNLAFLDGWRGLAILLVLEKHFSGLGLADAGRLGVDLFFVLSGRLMAEILFVRNMPIALFYKRRISRIMPTFLVFVLCMFLLAYVRKQPAPATDLLATLFFLRTYVGDQPIWESIVPIQHIWSLNVEEHCYIFLSLIAVAFHGMRRVIWLSISAGASLAFSLFYFRNPDIAPVDYELRTECASICLLLAAAYYTRNRLAPVRIPVWASPLALLLATICYTDIAPWYSNVFFAPPLLAFAVTHLDATPEWYRNCFSFRWLTTIGMWSFSLYLWQQPFYHAMDVMPAPVALLGAIVTALVSYYLLEMPVRRWLNARWARPAKSA